MRTKGGSPSTKLQYVAMGDSYSSGEGNPSFIPSTNSSEDKCHRSTDAYPYLLADDSDLNLHLVSNVACSGATTSDVLGEAEADDPLGKDGEPAQIGALSDQTNVVTLTVGGNDVGFAPYMTYCITNFCGPVTNSAFYNTELSVVEATGFSDALVNTYETILDDAPNAQVYVSEYPYLTTDTETLCDAVDVSGVYGLTTELNSVIDTAVGTVAADNSRLHLVPANASGSPFADKNICGSDSYFNNDVLLPSEDQVYSYHPNSSGHGAFKTIFKEVMTD